MRDTTMEKIGGFFLDVIITGITLIICLVDKLFSRRSTDNYKCWGCEREACSGCKIAIGMADGN